MGVRTLRGFGLKLLAAVTLMAPPVAVAAEKPRPLFADHAIIHLVIKAPFARLRSDRKVDAPAAGVLIVPGTSAETLPIKLSLRGVTRRRADICVFPPLKLEFDEKPPHGSLFAGQKKLKLAVHCQSAASAQKYILLEYAAYRLANVLTPLSFEVRLASIDYQEPDGRAVASRYAFLVESEKDLAKRNGLAEGPATHRVAISALSATEAARYAIFEYMIGNVDWSMTLGSPGQDCCHNTKLLAQPGATTGLIPISYDFDSSGLVAPPYALPPEGAGISDVRDRRYRGYCAHKTEAQSVAARILADRPKYFAVLDETPALDPGALRTADTYLGRFFDQLAADPALTGLFHTCIG